MTADENGSGYDELRWLAQDTHKRRRRAIWWTGGLVLGGMVFATAYVSRDNARTPPPPPPITIKPVSLEDIPGSLRNINDNLGKILDELKSKKPVAVNLFQTISPPEPGNDIRQVIWLIDGSRRFPMAPGHIIWIPEADSWLQLESVGKEPKLAPGDPKTKVTIWEANQPRPDDVMPIDLPKSLRSKRNTTTCVRISSMGRTQRPGFARDWIDIDVYFYTQTNQGTCPDEPPPTPP
jgi:hypothetical protein